jgi:hypothetical protein
MDSMLAKKKFEEGTLDDEGTVGVLPGEEDPKQKSKFLEMLGKFGSGMADSGASAMPKQLDTSMNLQGFANQQAAPMQSKYMNLRKLYGLE